MATVWNLKNFKINDEYVMWAVIDKDDNIISLTNKERYGKSSLTYHNAYYDKFKLVKINIKIEEIK